MGKILFRIIKVRVLQGTDKTHYRIYTHEDKTGWEFSGDLVMNDAAMNAMKNLLRGGNGGQVTADD